ncbi:LysR family transcriptional regulator [Ureibacillus thermophilus]|uniref:LysR family transcriptional regulator n=1 Tax=Ureibacillus thermophilus TaxID=367743 RepID=A0A4P6UQP3_9BACL|nr:LysR family transcriptional regulator [Ureibacillus thermophilus]QBK24867.1 LysR family transcriptional regulator [Ureibacillus thermophilus]
MKQYYAFLKVIERGSFTKAAEELGYTQSAISQMIQALEEELGTTLIYRSRKGITLTADGEEFLPFIKRVAYSHAELMEKAKEMKGLASGNIRIGTFTSVSSNWLPSLMQDFKKLYPFVQFHLQQGEYTSIVKYIKEGSVDFGFVNPDAAEDLETIALKEDNMLAILPEDHPLVSCPVVSLEDLAKEPFILLEEGEINEPLEAFKKQGLEPNIQYRVIDDYTIMSMVESGLGVSVLSEMVMNKVRYRFVIKKVDPPITRTIGIVYKNKKTLPIASRYFIDFMIQKLSAAR